MGVVAAKEPKAAAVADKFVLLYVEPNDVELIAEDAAVAKELHGNDDAGGFKENAADWLKELANARDDAAELAAAARPAIIGFAVSDGGSCTVGNEGTGKTMAPVVEFATLDKLPKTPAAVVVRLLA